MPEQPTNDEPVSRILRAAQEGDADSAAQLLPLVYEDLRKLAAARMARLSPGQTIQATVLVHEAYMRLVGSEDPGWAGRAHFFGAAARAMRHVLADHLRSRNCLKRGGDLQRQALEVDAVAVLEEGGPSDEVLAIEQVLEEFERDYPRQGEVVTLTFFGGLSNADVAESMGLSTRTIERDWCFARTWLNRRLRDPGADE